MTTNPIDTRIVDITTIELLRIANLLTLQQSRIIARADFKENTIELTELRNLYSKLMGTPCGHTRLRFKYKVTG